MKDARDERGLAGDEGEAEFVARPGARARTADGGGGEKDDLAGGLVGAGVCSRKTIAIAFSTYLSLK